MFQIGEWRAAGEKRLFLEEGFEGGARIVRARRAGPRSIGRRLALKRDARREKVAFIARVLFGNSRRNRLVALKTRRGVKVSALLATVQFKTAVGAAAAKVRVGRKNLAAARAARDLVRVGKFGGFRAEGFRLRRRAFFSASTRRVFVTTLTVFSFHKGQSEGHSGEVQRLSSENWTNPLTRLAPLVTLSHWERDEGLRLV